jgi:hypothetical protein
MLGAISVLAHENLAAELTGMLEHLRPDLAIEMLDELDARMPDHASSPIYRRIWQSNFALPIVRSATPWVAVHKSTLTPLSVAI